MPRPEFLLELVPYMDDPTVGIVQSPQFFDTTKQMNWIQRCAGSTQELFYRFIQPSRDALGAAVCVGTSALYRRAALDAIGGFPKIAQSEDIYTGLWMLDAGYSTRYVPVAVSKGVAPDNVDNFIAQQYRWCEGSITMLADRHFHTTPYLPLPARLCFWSGFLYYISTALSSLIIPLPAIVMAWFYPEWVRSWNTIWLAGALASWLVAYPLMMRGRWRIEVLRIQTVYGFAHLFNIIHLIRNRVAEWHPTGSKAPAPIAIKVQRFYTAYLGLTLSAAVIGLLLRAYQDGFTVFAGMLVFFVINLYIVGPLVVSGIGDEFRRRRRPRAAETAIQDFCEGSGVSTFLEERQIHNRRSVRPRQPSVSGSVVSERRLEWQDVLLSFAPPARRTSRAKARLTALRLPLILVLQAALTWRLNDIVNDDEALYIHGGYVAIAHLLHGGAQNAALLSGYGSYFSGAPNAYPVVAAFLDLSRRPRLGPILQLVLHARRHRVRL